MEPPPPAVLSPTDTLKRILAFGMLGMGAGLFLFLLTAADSFVLLHLQLDGAGQHLRFLALLALTVPGTALLGLALGLLASLLESTRLLATALLRRIRPSLRALDGLGLLTGAALLTLPLDFLSGLYPKGPRALLRAAVTGYHLYVSPLPFAVAWFRPLYTLSLFLLLLLLIGTGAWIFQPRGRATRSAALAASLGTTLLILLAYHHDSRPSYGHSEHTLHYPLAAAYSLLTIVGAGFAARALGPMEWATLWPRPLRRLALALCAFSLLITAHAQRSMDASPCVKALFWNRSILARRYAEVGRWLVDRDHDGSSPLFGGGDADDHDPQRSPLSREIPGNGIDDNGIGGDLPLAALPQAPRAPSPGEFVPVAPPSSAWNPRESPPGAVDLAAATAIPSSPTQGSDERRNVILISVDALRADRLSLYGNPRPTSPNLARWAAKGLTFTRAISQATNTGHSFSSLLRSSYGDAVLDPGVPTLTQLLKKAGYHTASLNSRRLDDWLLQKRWQPYRSTMTHDFDVLHLEGGAWWTAEELTDQAIAYVDRLPAGKPEFLWIHYNDTHQPRVPRPSYGYGSSDLDVYDAAVTFTDTHVGRLLDHLDARGILARSLVFFTADHGESFFEHGTFDHSNKPYMDNDHVPLLILAPGLAPRQITTPIGLIDLAPSALAFAGLPVPDVYRGIDLLAASRLPGFPERAIITEPPRNDPEAAFFAWAEVEGHFKYLYDRKGVTAELYDLEQDPGEQHNLVERDPARAEAMRSALGRFLDLEGNRRAGAATPVLPATTAPPPPAASIEGMALVPAGPFVMGADTTGEMDERPAHTVTLPAYYLDLSETTNEEYGRCVEKGVCLPPDPKNADANHFGPDSRFRAPRQPVSSIPWEAARGYCAWRGKRLPTEAEWEKAARGPDGRRFPWGNEEPSPSRAMFSTGVTAEVGSHPKGDGPYGHHDMAGNVWEWLEDIYDPMAYSRPGADRGIVGSCDEVMESLRQLRSQGKQGFTGSNPIPTECERVLRGGAFNYPAPGLRSSNRVHHPARYHLVMSGVRCARDAR